MTSKVSQAAVRGRVNAQSQTSQAQAARVATARWLYWSRGLRPFTLEGDIFGEPAWDLLLDLYIREKSGARSSVTSACIGSRAPHTTALRHIAALCRKGWITRLPDEADKRRFWLVLTSAAIEKLDQHFDKLAETVDFPTAEIHPLG
jgi:hypothetical protein